MSESPYGAKFKTRPTTEFIVIHCAATPPTMDIGADEIRRWHLNKGWLDIGYHWVIKRDGTVEAGRPHYVMGAHVGKRIPDRRHVRYNHVSLGICLVGGVVRAGGPPEDNFTSEQWVALHNMVAYMRAEYPDAQVVGHTDLDDRKACPSFDVATWLKR